MTILDLLIYKADGPVKIVDTTKVTIIIIVLIVLLAVAIKMGWFKDFLSLFQELSR